MIIRAALMLLLTGLWPAPGSADEAILVQAAFENAVKRAAPWVVTIESFGAVRKKPKPVKDPLAGGGNPLRRPGLPPGRGPTTGVILSEDGEILASSFYFPTDPAAIVVTLSDGQRHAAKILARDYSRGIALLKIDAKGLPAAHFADKGSVRVGQWALALGRSFGGDLPAAQMGIVSALDRISGKGIQTDTPTSPANYGGALVDIAGSVIGVIAPLSPRGEQAAVGLYDSGIGFAIPLWELQPVLGRLRSGETLHPPFLGVDIDQGQTFGKVIITRVIPETAAQRAGIRKDDRILRVGDRPVRTSFELRRELGRGVAGDEVTILLRRGEKEIEVLARPGKRPEKPD